VIRVSDVQKDDGLFVHIGTVASGIAKPGPVTARVDGERRRDTTRHHSATHLLHAALGRFIGAHVEQQGSKVSPEELRFDVNNPKALDAAQLEAVEAWVNGQIAAQQRVSIRELPIAEAGKLGAKAMFGEKYGAIVRVVSMGEGSPVSVEFCGGCHVGNTADIGAFRIIGEGATAAGIRRITAVAGRAAQALIDGERTLAEAAGRSVGLFSVVDAREVRELSRAFKCKLEEVPTRVAALAKEVLQAGAVGPTMTGGLVARVGILQEALKQIRKRAEQQAAQAAAGAADAIAAQVRQAGSVAFIAVRQDGLDGKALRALAEAVRGKSGDAVVVLASALDGKAGLCAVVPAALVKRGLSAGAIIGKLAPLVGGGGGGKPDFAQAGGKDPGGIDVALAEVPALVAIAV
jgi:alanyl-tRNA synthetase